MMVVMASVHPAARVMRSVRAALAFAKLMNANSMARKNALVIRSVSVPWSMAVANGGRQSLVRVLRPCARGPASVVANSTVQVKNAAQMAAVAPVALAVVRPRFAIQITNVSACWTSAMRGKNSVLITIQ